MPPASLLTVKSRCLMAWVKPEPFWPYRAQMFMRCSWGEEVHFTCSQAAPRNRQPRDIEDAKALWPDYKRRRKPLA
jgi:hypothetical protein